jgi:ubiquinone/menaquinone biosynthesis C-methylase UbiE
MSLNWSEGAKKYDYFTQLTKQFAVRMVDLVKGEIEKERFTGQINLLDVACGTGIVPITFLKHLPDKLNILATDLAEEMANIAEQKILTLNMPNVSVKVMDGQALSLDSDSFDVCTNLFGLIFFPDRPKGFQEMFRVLKPEGMAIVGTWHSLQTMDIARAIAKYYNKPHNPELDKAFSLADRTLITKEMTDAGFRDVCVERITINWTITDKAQFEEFLMFPIYSYNLDKQQLAKDLPTILDTVIPDYKNISTFQLRCVANIGYGFK